MIYFPFLPGLWMTAGLGTDLMEAAIEELVDLRLVEGELLHLSSVVQTEVQQDLLFS